VDDSLNRGLSNVGISAAIAELGGTLDRLVIARHKENHWTKPVNPDAPRPTMRDLAITMRDKVLEAVEPMDAEALLYMGKDLAPMIGQGLKAQAILDKREQATKKNTQADILLSLLAALRGEGRPMLQIEDGTVVDGVAVALD
jgi:hypothetical protein